MGGTGVRRPRRRDRPSPRRTRRDGAASHWTTSSTGLRWPPWRQSSRYGWGQTTPRRTAHSLPGQGGESPTWTWHAEARPGPAHEAHSLADGHPHPRFDAVVDRLEVRHVVADAVVTDDGHRSASRVAGLSTSPSYESTRRDSVTTPLTGEMISLPAPGEDIRRRVPGVGRAPVRRAGDREAVRRRPRTQRRDGRSPRPAREPAALARRRARTGRRAAAAVRRARHARQTPEDHQRHARERGAPRHPGIDQSRAVGTLCGRDDRRLARFPRADAAQLPAAGGAPRRGGRLRRRRCRRTTSRRGAAARGSPGSPGRGWERP